MIGIDKIDLIKRRLSEPLPGLAAQNKMAARVRELPVVIPNNAKLSAVLAILFPVDDALNLVLIKRVDDGKPHSGQISFPGGRKDANDASLQDTALRETFEEIGVPSKEIKILGELTSLYIPVSYSQVHPFVGYMQHQPKYKLNDNEVQYTLEVPLHEFFAHEKKVVTKITPAAFPDITLTAPAYQWDADHLIWGATAMIISELEALFIEG